MICITLVTKKQHKRREVIHCRQEVQSGHSTPRAAGAVTRGTHA